MICICEPHIEQSLIDKLVKMQQSKAFKDAVSSSDTKKLRKIFNKIDKKNIKIALSNNQHGLCAYCMKSLKDDNSSIEHYLSIKTNPEETLNFSNYLCVCNGGSTIPVEQDEKRILCCDKSRKDTMLTINPKNPLHIELITYTKDGKIDIKERHTEDTVLVEKLRHDINHVLCLNGKLDIAGNTIADTQTKLVKGRRDAYSIYESIMKDLRNKTDISLEEAIEEKMNQLKNEQEYIEFIGVIFFFLKRQLKILKTRKEHNK